MSCRNGPHNSTFSPIYFSLPTTVYISGRPFVLRDASEPRRTLSLSDRAENLEAIELRLKNDILQEASRFGGLVLTHNEVGLYNYSLFLWKVSKRMT